MPRTNPNSEDPLRDENAELRTRLEEAEEMLRAIRHGEVDALVVGDQLYMLTSAEAASNQLRGMALAQVSDAVITVDNDSRVTWLNAAAERQYAVSATQVLGRPLQDLYECRWSEPEGDAAAQRSLRETGHWRGEAIHRAPGGAEFHIESAVSVLRNEHGAAVGLLSVSRDISQRKNVEMEREQLLAKERAAREAAEDATRAKDEFLATVSHELRTPLSAILGWAEMLERGTLDEPSKVLAMETIMRNAKTQARLVDDLLDVSRIISGKLSPELRPLELASVVRPAIDSVRHVAKSKAIQVELTLEPGFYPIVGDASRLQQVVWNLLSNAVKFTPRGGRVHVTLTRDDTHARIAVSDTGEGISREFLPHVFDRFRQADGSTTRRHGGLGLGLAIVHQLVDMHGGSVEAHSDGVGRGARFTVTVPLVAVRAMKLPPGVNPREMLRDKVDRAILRGLRILEVDDDLDTREMLKEALEQRGADVLAAGSAKEAFEVLVSYHPDVLICDIGMPGEDGYSLMRKIRALSNDNGLRAVALTGYAHDEERTRALSAGFQTFVSKPVELDTLVQTIANLVGRA